jgi:hypothetical protein
MNNNYVTCTKCGWVHFPVSRQHAEKEVTDFNAYFETLPKNLQDDFYAGKGAAITLYERCFHCGGSYKDFRLSKYGDCPDGCTIQPILGADQ